MSQCPGCGAELKNIPAGVSKTTGRPYEAFVACSNKCGWKPTKEPGVTKVLVHSEMHKSNIPENNIKEKTMILSYAKDVVVKRMEVGIAEPGDAAVQIIAIYRQLCSEVFNPLK
uniref:Uncharacterized protein n=1 Tax=viral metagenome TaxID=1070528 RepID=A0A6M3JF73_9ZZZZ